MGRIRQSVSQNKHTLKFSKAAFAIFSLVILGFLLPLNSTANNKSTHNELKKNPKTSFFKTSFSEYVRAVEHIAVKQQQRKQTVAKATSVSNNQPLNWYLDMENFMMTMMNQRSLHPCHSQKKTSSCFS